VLNATFSNISAISWRPDLVVEEAGVPGENHRPWASNWSRNVILHMIFFSSKHQEYEQKLLENYMNQQNSANNHVIPTSSKPIP
jgi:hypothetical protein